MIAELEAAGPDSFTEQRAALSVLEGREHTELFRKLLRMNVERASQHPRDTDEHVHRVFVSVGRGGSASGSDESVVLLCGALALKDDNAKEFSASGAEQRHRFVWIDGATPFAIECALSHEAPLWNADGDSGFCLSSAAPQRHGIDLAALIAGVHPFADYSEAFRSLDAPSKAQPRTVIHVCAGVDFGPASGAARATVSSHL